MKRFAPWFFVAVLFGVLPSFVPLASATVNEQTARNASVGDGTTTAFSFTFKIITKNDIEVLVDGVTKTVDTDYTVTGMGVSGGGTVTFTTAPASAAKVTLLRKQAAAQASDYIAGQSFPAEGVERDLDKLAMQVQQDRETLARTLRAKKEESLDMTLPAVAARKSKVLGFDTTGLPTGVDLTAGASGGDVSLSTAIASGAVTSRSMASRFADIANVKDWGVTADGTADDVAELVLALQADNSVSVPTGTVLLPRNAATVVTTNTATQIQGMGDQSILKLQETSTTGVSEWFTMGADGFVMRNLKLLFDKTQVGVSTALGVLTRYSRIILDGVTIDGQTALVGGTQDRSIQIIKSSTTTGTKDVSMVNSLVEDAARVYTRDNANTTDQSIMKFIGNTFRNMWRTVLTFNAPNGSLEDVLVLGNSFDTHAGAVNNDSALAGNSNAVGFTGVRGGRMIGNHVSGTYGAVAHIEETTDGAAIIGNTARMANDASSDAAMEILANNVSGSAVTPKHVAHIGNVLRSTDGVGSGFQIQSAASADGLQWGVYSGNISAGFDDAFKTSTAHRSVLIADNILRGTTNALDLARASLLVRGNVVDNATVPINVARGGLMGAVHYVNLSSATAALTSFGATTAGPLTLTEWTWESDLFTLANGTTNLDIGPMPTRIYGFITIAVTQSGSQHRLTTFEVSYDGATFTNTSKLSYGSGDITITGPSDNAGQFAITLADASGPSSDVRVQVRFHGGAFVIN